MARATRALPLLLALVLGLAPSCNVLSGELPAQPRGAPPQVLGFLPEVAFAGERVSIQLEGEVRASPVLVRFGTSAPQRAAFDAQTWWAEVPVDATTGPLVISNAFGETIAPGVFTARGLGHVRSGRIARRRRIAPTVLEALTSSVRGAAYVLISAPVRAVQIDQAGVLNTEAEPGGVVPLGMAMNGATDRFVVVGGDVSGECRAPAGAPALVAVVFQLAPDQEVASLGLQGARLCLGLEAHAADLRVAADPSAGHLLVVTREATGSMRPDVLSLVDVAAGTLLSRAAAPGEHLRTPAWAGDAFVVAQGDGLRRVQPVQQPDAWERSAVPVDEDWLEHVGVVAAGPGGKLAVGMNTGRVIVSDSGWPPAFDEELDLTVMQVSPGDYGTDVAGLAYSTEGTELLTTQEYFARAVLHRKRGGPWVPVGTTPLRGPSRVNAAPNGTFAVATSEGAVLLSSEGGGVVLPLTTGSLPRALRAGRCPSGEPVLAVGSASFPLVFRLDPLTLEDAACGPLAVPWLSETAVIQEVEPLTSGALFVQWDDNAEPNVSALTRVRADGSSEGLPDALTIAPILSERRLRLVAGGAVLAGFDPERHLLELFDAGAPDWTKVVPRHLPLPNGIVDALETPGGLFAIVDARELRLLSAKALLTDTTSEPRRITLATEPQLAALMGDDLLLVGKPVAGRCAVDIVSTIDGAHASAGVIVTTGELRALVSSPDGTRLYVLDEDERGARSVLRFVYDRDGRRLVGSEPPVPVQTGDEQADFRAMLPSAGGERLYLLDTFGDSVISIE